MNAETASKPDSTVERTEIASAGWEGAVGEARRAKLRAKTHNA
jgi:hypothetical protein